MDQAESYPKVTYECILQNHKPMCLPEEKAFLKPQAVKVIFFRAWFQK